MKHIAVLLILFCAAPLLAQQPTLVFDPVEGAFSDRSELPAETPFQVQGDLPQEVLQVRLDIRDPGSKLGELLFGQAGTSATYRRPLEGEAGYYRIRVPYALRGGREQDLVLTYFRAANAAERAALAERLENTLGEFLDLRLTRGDSRLKWSGGSNALLADAETLVTDAISNTAHTRKQPFIGFSDLVSETVERADELATNKEGKEDEERASRDAYLQRVLHTMMRELEHLHDETLLVVYEQYILKSYPVAKSRTELHVQAGYAGVYFGGGFQNLEYDAAPFVGLRIPLGNPALRSAFWANTSFDLGAFITNFEDSEGRTISGPVVGRPFYAGLSYKLISFFRINAGAAVLERGGGDDFFDVGQVEVRPYVGLSGSFRIWMKLDNQ